MSSFHIAEDITRYEKHREAAIAMFEGLSGDAHTSYYLAVDKSPDYSKLLGWGQQYKPPYSGPFVRQPDGVLLIKTASGPCHASIPSDFENDWKTKDAKDGRTTYKVKDAKLYVLATGLGWPKAYEHEACTFWNWLSDGENINNPWRRIFEYGEDEAMPIFNKETGRQTGIILGSHVLNSVHIPMAFIKNFCIACRFPVENHARLKFWHTLVTNYGVAGHDAYLLASIFVHRANSLTEAVLTPNTSGGHWPFTFSVMNYKRYSEGTIRPKSSTVNGCWFQDGDKNLNDFYETMAGTKHETVKNAGSFAGSTTVYAISDIVERFEKWKTDNGF